MGDLAPKDVQSGADLVEGAAVILDAAIIRLQLMVAEEEDDPGCLERRHFAGLERELRATRRSIDCALGELGKPRPHSLDDTGERSGRRT